MLKASFEKLLMLSRIFVILPVISGIVSAIILFLSATIDILSMLIKIIVSFESGKEDSTLHAFVVSEIIGAVDLYLIAIVMLIFSFGIYELFISEIKMQSRSLRTPSILTIGSLDELKDKLAKVIVMVLVVSYFQRVLYTKYTGALEMMYFALSIAALSVGVYLLHKDLKFKSLKDPQSNGENGHKVNKEITHATTPAS